MKSSKQDNLQKSTDKTELTQINPNMTREQITRNLVNALKNSGFKITNKRRTKDKSNSSNHNNIE